MEKRKVSPSGLVSFKGTKYYIKDPRFHQEIVEVEANPDNSLNVKFNDVSIVVHPFKLRTRKRCVYNPWNPFPRPIIIRNSQAKKEESGEDKGLEERQ